MADPTPSDGPFDAAAIDELIKQASALTTSAPASAPPAGPSPAAAPAASPFPDQQSIEELLRQATFEEAGPGGSPGGGGAGAHQAIDAEAFKLPNFNQVIQDAQVSSIDLLRDVELNVKIELGRARMLVEDVLKLSEGSVVELDKLAGDPVDVFVNDRLVARGEVLVLNDNFCVRVNEIVAGTKEEGL